MLVLLALIVLLESFDETSSLGASGESNRLMTSLSVESVAVSVLVVYFRRSMFLHRRDLVRM